MIQTGSIKKRSVSFRVLTDDQIVEIRRTAFEVMSKVGFRVYHEGARKMLKQAGALVDDEIVKVPEHIVAECLSTTPKGWTIYDRTGKRAMEVEGRKSYYGTSTPRGVYPRKTMGLVVLVTTASNSYKSAVVGGTSWTDPMGMTQSMFARASATLAPMAISATRVG